MKGRYISTQPAIFALYALLFFFANPAMAQESILKSEYSYRRYTTHNGLPNLLLETVFQDNRGFLWMGTYKGFCRFDGISFSPFLSETSINILHLENDTDGNVRVYTSMVRYKMI